MTLTFQIYGRKKSTVPVFSFPNGSVQLLQAQLHQFFFVTNEVIKVELFQSIVNEPKT